MFEPAITLRARGGWAEDALERRDQPPFGPRNTWSNLAYAVVALVLVWLVPTGAMAMLAVGLLTLATGSALYHAYKTINANRLDWLGMMATLGGLAGYALTPWAAPGVLVVALGASLAYAKTWQDRDTWLVVLGLVGAAGGLPRHHLAWVGLGLLCLGLAYGAWQLDQRHSWWVGVWGHAAWHVGTALGIGALAWAATP